jgi:hypothetical protein
MAWHATGTYRMRWVWLLVPIYSLFVTHF